MTHQPPSTSTTSKKRLHQIFSNQSISHDGWNAAYVKFVGHQNRSKFFFLISFQVLVYETSHHHMILHKYNRKKSRYRRIYFLAIVKDFHFQSIRKDWKYIFIPRSQMCWNETWEKSGLNPQFDQKSSCISWLSWKSKSIGRSRNERKHSWAWFG